MKYARIENGVIIEIIPSEATVPSVAHWYGEDFSAKCKEVPDDSEQGWVFDAVTGIYAPPEPEAPKPIDPSPEEKLRADVDYLAALQGVAL